MFDSHIHTRFSTDSKMGIEQAINRSKELGLGLVLTDHMDLLSIKDLENMSGGHFVFDLDEYFSEFGPYRSNTLKLGVEFGINLKSELYDAYGQMAEEYPLDYVLGSIHFVNGVDLCDPAYYDGKDKAKAYQEYFLCMLDNVRKYCFIDCLAHIDYITRYTKFTDRDIDYNAHGDIIDEILKTIISNGTVIEINASRLQDRNAADSLACILRRYRQLGGLYAAMGSDAHKVEQIGRNSKLVSDLADHCDLQLVHFEERTMVVD